ncbi:hypothetical protein [Burkholderia sp. Bp9012]|nr:hypothetical protein [Burkholderia sp. Bp9012]
MNVHAGGRWRHTVPRRIPSMTTFSPASDVSSTKWRWGRLAAPI